MTRTILIVVYLLSGMAQAADNVILRTAISPQQPWVGQKVSLFVDVLAKDKWAQIKKVRETDINGAYLLKLESQGTRLNETIKGDSYSGQRYELLLFPQRDGKVVVPAVPVDVEVKSWGSTVASKTRRLQTPHTEFVVRMPPDADNVRGLISTSDFSVTQTWQPDTGNLQRGDAIKRTIIMESAEVAGMAFAPLQHTPISGLAIYPGEPLVQDSFNRGELTGKRVETVTYVIERTGDIDIPEFVFTWWNVETGKLHQTTLAGRRLSIAAVDGTQTSYTSTLQSNSDIVLAAVTFISVITGLLTVFFRARFQAHWHAWRMARSNSEANAFRQLRRSLRSCAPDEVLRDTMCWLDSINTDTQAARFDRFCTTYGDASLLQNYRYLSEAMSGDRRIDWPALSAGLLTARRHWRQAQRRQRHNIIVLPALNGVAKT